MNDRLAARWASVPATTLVYAVGRLAAEVIAGRIEGRPPAFDVAGELGGAIVAGLALAWLAGRVAGTAAARIGVLTTVAWASVAAVMIEGSAFAPDLAPVDRLPLEIALQLGVCLAAAAVATRTAGGPVPVASSGPPAGRGVVRAALGGTAAYVVAYLVFGALNYLLVTGPYYESRAGGLTTPEPTVVLAVAALEGLLLALATIPAASTLTGSTGSRALTAGLVLWMLGGVAPLLQQAGLPDVLRLASAVEILFQKVPLGVTVVWLYARTVQRPALASSPIVMK